ncbi:MAG TPA: tRNA pseudouridine(38-40) synthase TruA [Hyphomicrobiales bacterium]|nr:tRNA pseudouridine(38-40) synthase TruA [Hyphomicrobiales bacterium]
MMSLESPARRVALGVEYNGAAFNGWQAQASPRVATVQESLETALAAIAAAPLRVNCAGRTDAGVHASWQVVHFDPPTERPLKAWVRGVNSLLPPQVAVRWAHEVPDDFHARFSALSRCYRYLIFNAPARAGRLASLVTSHFAPLDAARMRQAGQYLLGEHDFSAYRGAGCQSRTPMRNVLALDVERLGDYVSVTIEANAFLLHMVRNIVGMLLAVGEGVREPQWAAELLAGRDRRLAAKTAPAAGLTLVGVRYPAHFALPEPDLAALPFA